MTLFPDTMETVLTSTAVKRLSMREELREDVLAGLLHFPKEKYFCLC